MITIDDITFKDFEPTREDMIDTIYEAKQEGDGFTLHPWQKGENPTKEEIGLVYNVDKAVHLTGYYLQACLYLSKPIPVKYKNSIERTIDPERFFKKLDSIEQQIKISFDLFLSTNPTRKEAIDKLIQLSKDYWQEDLSPELASKQLDQYYSGRF